MHVYAIMHTWLCVLHTDKYVCWCKCDDRKCVWCRSGCWMRRSGGLSSCSGSPKQTTRALLCCWGSLGGSTVQTPGDQRSSPSSTPTFAAAAVATTSNRRLRRHLPAATSPATATAPAAINNGNSNNAAAGAPPADAWASIDPSLMPWCWWTHVAGDDECCCRFFADRCFLAIEVVTRSHQFISTGLISFLIIKLAVGNVQWIFLKDKLNM